MFTDCLRNLEQGPLQNFMEVQYLLARGDVLVRICQDTSRPLEERKAAIRNYQDELSKEEKRLKGPDKNPDSAIPKRKERLRAIRLLGSELRKAPPPMPDEPPMRGEPHSKPLKNNPTDQIPDEKGVRALRWLHLSDIHYDPHNSGRATEQLRDKLPAYIVEKGIKADRLFVTGDFRHAAYQKEDQNAKAAHNAAEFILQIADAAGVTPDHIDLVPGNHDLARAEDAAGKRRIGRIQKEYDSNNGRFSPEDAAFLLNRFAFFRAVQGELEKAGYRSPWKENAARLDGNPSNLHAVRILDDCALLYLNTSILCNSDRERGQLLIGNYDLYQSLKAIQERNSDKPIIVLAHHGLDNFRDDEKKAVERLFKDFPVTLYLCGDAHETWQRTTNGFYELTMGCLRWEKGVQIVFSTGELPAKALPWRVTAHEWDERYNCWGEYTHFNQELEKDHRLYSTSIPPPKAEIVTLERSARPSGAFVGREDKIQEIEQAFQDGETAVVLYGMEGNIDALQQLFSNE